MSRKLKCLIDCTPLSGGGGVQVAIALLANLRMENTIDWAALVPHGMRSAMPGDLASLPSMLFFQKRNSLDRIKSTYTLRKLELRMRPDVVFSVFGPTLFRPQAPHLVGFAKPHMIYARESGMPRLSTREAAMNTLAEFLFRRADDIVVETETARRRFLDQIGYDPHRIHVIGNAPNPLLRRLPEISRADQTFDILMPSASYWHKNLDMAPLIALEISKLAPALNFVIRLTLAKESKQWKKIESVSRVLGVERHVDTLGVLRIDELSLAYCSTKVVYLPTQREISTAVYPEAFFFRRALVTSDEDFARELCGNAAIFTPARDVRAAANHIVNLAQSPELYAYLVHEGEKQLRKKYPSPKEKFEMQLALLDSIATSGRRRRMPD